MYQGELYEPNEIDNELFLSTVPLDLIEEAIKTQFNDPLEHRKTDYVQSFLNKYQFSLDNMREDEQEDLDALHDDFIAYMKEIFSAYLNVGFPDIYDLPEDDQHELIHFSYRFFIMNIKKNFVNLVWHYITEKKDEIQPLLEKKKDVVYLNFKSELNNEYDVLILSNLSSIVNYVLTQEYTVDDFFECIKGDEMCLETEFVCNKFDEYTITGNFVPNYISMVDGYFCNDIESKIRNKILKKYPKRKSAKSEIVHEEPETVDDNENE